MPDCKLFTFERYENVSLLMWTKSAATPVLCNDELQVELQAFILTTNPSCVVVSFALIDQCPSSLIGGLVGLSGKLTDRGSRLKLCEMKPSMREQFDRLNLDRVFEIHDSLSEAIAAYDNETRNGGQHA